MRTLFLLVSMSLLVGCGEKTTEAAVTLTMGPLEFCHAGVGCRRVFQVDKNGTLMSGPERKLGVFSSDGRLTDERGEICRLWPDGKVTHSPGGNVSPYKMQLEGDGRVTISTPRGSGTLTLKDDGTVLRDGAPFMIKVQGVTPETKRFATFATLCVTLGGGKKAEASPGGAAPKKVMGPAKSKQKSP